MGQVKSNFSLPLDQQQQYSSSQGAKGAAVRSRVEKQALEPSGTSRTRTEPTADIGVFVQEQSVYPAMEVDGGSNAMGKREGKSSLEKRRLECKRLETFGS